MKYINLQKIIHMDYLIKHQSTGIPEDFAQKLEISRAMLFNYLTYMREELMLEIEYSRSNMSYHYNGKDLSSFFNFNGKNPV